MCRTFRLLPAAAGCVLLTVLACQKPLQDDEPSSRATTPVAGHAVHSDRLQDVMRGLGEQVRASWPQEIADERAADAARDREARFQEAARLGRMLADSAPRIKGALAGVHLAGPERQAFIGHVAGLEHEARDLEAAAIGEQADATRTALGRVRATCTACHEQFAELAGPIQFGPADP